MATETTVYDTYGSPDWALDFRGQKTDWVYDYDLAGDTRLGRLRRVDYSAAGAPTPAETVRYGYDAEGRPTTVTESAAGQADRVTQTSYDAAGRVVRVSGPEPGAVVSYRYDDATGRLVGMWTGGGAWGTGPTQVEYGYDPLGRLRTVTERRRADQAASTSTRTTAPDNEDGEAAPVGAGGAEWRTHVGVAHGTLVSGALWGGRRGAAGGTTTGAGGTAGGWSRSTPGPARRRN